MIRALRQFLGAMSLALGAATAASAEPVIFAAASTRSALDAALASRGETPAVSYAASGTIARQIALGAPADIFISANPRWMQYLVEKGRVDPAEIRVLAANRLVLIAPAGSTPLPLETTALATRISGEFFATADPATAPVGQYGQEALIALGLWETVAPSLLPTRNTLATVATVARGEAALGLAYQSDATGVPGISIAAELPQDSHSQIRYLIAPVSGSSVPDAAHQIITFLTGRDGQTHFIAHGFAPIAGEGS